MLKVLPVEIAPHDVKWLAQTVHNAYHDLGVAPYWDVCPKTVCKYLTDLLDAHDKRINELYTPEWADPVTSTSRPSRKD